MKKVCVLMSTYNGEKYLREQLNSILSQREVCVDILIRDDGSKDSTIDILKEYNKRDNVTYYCDNRNLGAGNSFIDLMWYVDMSYDYYALSDQDDYWLQDKLYTGIDFLEKNSNYSVYSSYYTMVDEELKPIKNNINSKRHEPTLGNAMIDNQVTGCTVIMSKSFLEKIRKYRRPENQYIHDWWIYKLGMIFGGLYIDKKSKILYRQHGNNTIGLDENIFKRIARIIHNSSKMKLAIEKQDREFQEIYPLGDNEKELFEIIDKKYGAIKLLANREISRKSRIETFFYKLWILTW